MDIECQTNDIYYTYFLFALEERIFFDTQVLNCQKNMWQSYEISFILKYNSIK